MQELCKKFLQTVNKPLLVFFLIFLLSFIVLADNLVEPYNDPITFSAGDIRWCRRNGVCTLSTLTVDAIVTGNLSIIGQVFNVTMNLVTWNITDNFNVGGNLVAKNITSNCITLSNGTQFCDSFSAGLWENSTGQLKPKSPQPVNVSVFNTGNIINNEIEAYFGTDYGAIAIGDIELFISNMLIGGLNVNGTFIIRNTDGDSNIMLALVGANNKPRWVVPKEGPNHALYNPRSQMIGGVLGQAFDDGIINCSNQGYRFIDCNTSGTGADLGLQDDLEFWGALYGGNGTWNVNDDGEITASNFVYQNGQDINSTILWENSIGEAKLKSPQAIDMQIQPIKNILSLSSPDGSIIAFGNNTAFLNFSGLDQAVIIGSNQSLAEGENEFCVLNINSNKILFCLQSGKNDSGAYIRNSVGIFPDLGFNNASILTDTEGMWSRFGITPNLDYFSAINETSLAVQFGIETQQIYTHDGNGNGLVQFEGEFIVLLREGADADFYGGPIHSKIPRQENITFGIGDVELFEINYDGIDTGEPPTPFVQTSSGGGANEWFVRNGGGRCFSNPCIRAKNGLRTAVNNFSTFNVSAMTLSFYHGSKVGDNCSIYMNNNSGSGNILLWNYTLGVDIKNPPEFVVVSVPDSMNNQSVVSLEILMDDSNGECYLDNILLNGTAGSPITIEVTQNDALIEFGGTTFSDSRCDIFVNGSTNTMFVGLDPACSLVLPENVTAVNLNLITQNISGDSTIGGDLSAGSFTLDSETIFNWDNLTNFIKGLLTTDNGSFINNSINEPTIIRSQNTSWITDNELDPIHNLNLSNNLLIWLRMDDVNSSGDGVIDFIGNSNGTANDSAIQSSGIIGKSFEFDGNSDFIDIPDGSNVDSDLNNSFTFSFWYKADSVVGTIFLMSKFFGGIGEVGYHTSLMTTNISFLANDYDCLGGGSTVTAQYTDHTEWTNAVIVYNGTQLKIYLQGILSAAVFYSNGICDESTTLRIGNHQTGITTLGFDGKIDDFRIYNSSLSQSEITQLYLLGDLEATTQLERAYYTEYVSSPSGYFNNLVGLNTEVITLSASNISTNGIDADGNVNVGQTLTAERWELITTSTGVGFRMQDDDDGFETSYSGSNNELTFNTNILALSYFDLSPYLDLEGKNALDCYTTTSMERTKLVDGIRQYDHRNYDDVNCGILNVRNKTTCDIERRINETSYIDGLGEFNTYYYVDVNCTTEEVESRNLGVLAELNRQGIFELKQKDEAKDIEIQMLKDRITVIENVNASGGGTYGGKLVLDYPVPSSSPDWVLEIEIGGDSEDYRGMKITAGEDEPGTVYAIDLFDGDGDDLGGWQNDEGTNAFWDNSDERLKEDIVNWEANALDIIGSINFVEFRYKGSNVIKVGLIAQQVDDYINESVKLVKRTYVIEEGESIPNRLKILIDEDSPIIKSYHTENETITIKTESYEFSKSYLIPYLWEGMQELIEENQMLKDELCLKDNTYSWCK